MDRDNLMARLDEINAELPEMEDEYDWLRNTGDEDDGHQADVLMTFITELDQERQEIMEKFPEVKYWPAPTGEAEDE